MASRARTHYRLRQGRPACGAPRLWRVSNVTTTADIHLVDCRLCRATEAFKRALRSAETDRRGGSLPFVRMANQE